MNPSKPEDISLLCLDVDGVLTDGSIQVGPDGEEIKRFYVRDGIGIRVWQRCGGQVAIITGRDGPAIRHRAAELGVDRLHCGVKRKGPVFDEMLGTMGLEPAQVAMVGDDLPDLPIFGRCGYPVAVQDAAEEIRDGAAFVTQAPGGHGAVREVVEHLLRAQGRWSEVVESYRDLD